MNVPLVALLSLLPQQPASPVAEPPAELVFVADESPVPLASLQLGDGGVRLPEPLVRLQSGEGAATTPGGVVVAALDEGVKVTFPSGRELLFAPDGFLHLRSGELAGPFPAGVELFFGDDSTLRIARSGSRRDPIGEVSVTAHEVTRRIWRRGRSVDEFVREAAAGGERLLCCGDGGDLYAATSLTPVLVCERVLCPQEHERQAPPLRVAVLSAALIQSLQQLPREVAKPVGDQQEALRLAASVARTGARVFATEAAPRRVERKEPRYALAGGYEIGLALDGPAVPRLQLFTGRDAEPFVEWTLGFGSQARVLGAPAPDQPVAAARGSVRLGEAVPALAPRRELREVEAAHGRLRRLVRQ